uniref:Uncharacterized protein n=1 Tax=Tanacetum cinerariifolium TaxID=118510 RepID=A0A6L2L961_TANCI|nr:hypothetical protein [Tanacetum cinerariifolium]
MNTTQAQQKALDDALISPADRLEFEKCNMRLHTDIKPKEATFQVVLDALARTPFYQAFLITVDDQSISRRNKMFWHIARDDTMFTSMRCISKHEKIQVYGAILLKDLTNQAMLESKAYKIYYAFASGEKTPKLNKKDFYISHESGSGDRVNTQSKVPDEQQQKTFGTDEGTGTIPRVPDVPIYDSKSDKDDEMPDPYKSNDEHDEEEEYDDEFNVEEGEKMDEEEDDEVTKELYKYVNVNLGNKDANMTNADQSGADQQNASQQSGFKQEEKDTHVTLTPILDTQKTGGPTQSSSVSSDFTSKLLNLDNPSPTNTTIASLMDTTIHHEITSTTTQVDQYAQALSSIPAIVDRYMDNKLGEAINKAIQAHNFNCREEAQAEKREYIELVDSTKNVTESLEAAVLAISSSQPQSSYEVATTLSKFELTKILIEKMEKNKSFDVADYKRELYDALFKSYNIDKDIFESYGEVFSLKRSQDNKDKDQDPSAGSDRGTKRRKSSKDAESSRDSKSKEKKSSSISKDASQSQHKSSGKSANAEEPSHTVEDSGMQQDQVFVTRDNDKQLADKEVTKADCQVACAEESPTSFDELNDTSFDFSAFSMNRLQIPNLTQEILVGPAFNLLKGDFKRLRLQDIEDMLLLLVQQSLTNLTIDERKRLMCADELHKFSDGTLNDVWSALYDIVAGIRMEYLPMRKWSNLDKKMAWIMVQDIDKQLYQRRLMRNLEKFVGGRVYGNDLRLLERTI